MTDIINNDFSLIQDLTEILTSLATCWVSNIPTESLIDVVPLLKEIYPLASRVCGRKYCDCASLILLETKYMAVWQVTIILPIHFVGKSNLGAFFRTGLVLFSVNLRMDTLGQYNLKNEIRSIKIDTLIFAFFIMCSKRNMAHIFL